MVSIKTKHRNQSCYIKLILVFVGLIVGCSLANFHIILMQIEPIPTPSAKIIHEEATTVPYPQHVPRIEFKYNKTIAHNLRKQLRIMCLIMTEPANHTTKAQHIRQTWGRHCNTLLFMSSVEDLDLPNSVPLSKKVGLSNVWARTREALNYVYTNHRNDADWFLQADDNSYVVMENLRAMLHPYPSDLQIYFGLSSADPLVHSNFVLSKHALERFVETGIQNSYTCLQTNDSQNKDYFAKCMKDLGVISGFSYNGNGVDRLNLNISPLEAESVPSNAISFHNENAKSMYLYEYGIYQIQRYGIAQVPLPVEETKLTMDVINKLMFI